MGNSLVKLSIVTTCSLVLAAILLFWMWTSYRDHQRLDAVVNWANNVIRQQQVAAENLKKAAEQSTLPAVEKAAPKK